MECGRIVATSRAGRSRPRGRAMQPRLGGCVCRVCVGILRAPVCTQRAPKVCNLVVTHIVKQKVGRADPCFLVPEVRISQRLGGRPAAAAVELAATSAFVQQEMIRGASGRMVKVDSLAGRTAQVELLRQEVADLKEERDEHLITVNVSVVRETVSVVRETLLDRRRRKEEGDRAITYCHKRC